MRQWATAVVAAVVLGILPGCAAATPPEEVVRDFLLAWQSGRYRAAAEYTTGEPDEVAAALRGAAVQLGADELRFGLGPFRRGGDTAEARFDVEVGLLGEQGPRWSYRGRLSLRRAGGWQIVWSPGVIHPQLRPGERLAVVTEPPPRAPILDAESRALVAPEQVVTLGFRPGDPSRTTRSVEELARLTGIDARTADMVVRAAPERAFVPLVTLSRSAYRRLRPELTQVPGVTHREHTLPVKPGMPYADDVVGEVGPATTEALRQTGSGYSLGGSVGLSGLQLSAQRRLAGTPETKVVAQDESGHAVRVLARWPGEEARPVRTTLNREVQSAAASALGPLEQPASLVAVDSGTGEILAAANRGTDDNAAFLGHFPPGDVFRLVSSAALLDTGLEVSTRIPCPPQRIVGGEVFRNTPSVATPRAPAFRVSFANSCTTAFVGLARRLPAHALTTTAGRYGVGDGWSLALPAFTGFLPAPRSDAEKAASMIGKGPVRVSPITMALAVAAVDSGTWRPPRLVTDPPTGGTSEPRPLPHEQVEPLRALLRASVEAGSGAPADLPGEQVYGMAGAAASPASGDGKRYAWFVGYRGDVAFTLVLTGAGAGDSERMHEPAAAADAAARFLDALGRNPAGKRD